MKNRLVRRACFFLRYLSRMRWFFYTFFLVNSTLACAQESWNDSLLADAFRRDVAAMVDSLHLEDSVKVRFYEIYNAYGERMRVAYENRTSWIALNHVYQWEVRERDTRMKEILTRDQLDYFKERQHEIEQAARARKKEASTGEH